MLRKLFFSKYHQKRKKAKLKSPSVLLSLPEEIWLLILMSGLSYLDILRLSHVNKYFASLTADNLIWDKFYKINFQLNPASRAVENSSMKLLKHFQDSSNGLFEPRFRFVYRQPSIKNFFLWANGLNIKKLFLWSYGNENAPLFAALEKHPLTLNDLVNYKDNDGLVLTEIARKNNNTALLQFILHKTPCKNELEKLKLAVLCFLPIADLFEGVLFNDLPRVMTLAVRVNNIEAIQALKQRDVMAIFNDPHYYFPNPQWRRYTYTPTLLHIAAKKGHFEAMQELLPNDTMVNIFVQPAESNHFTFGPALYEAIRQDHGELVNLLIYNYAELSFDSTSSFKKVTALHVAAAHNRIAILEKLLAVNDPHQIETMILSDGYDGDEHQYARYSGNLLNIAARDENVALAVVLRKFGISKEALSQVTENLDFLKKVELFTFIAQCKKQLHSHIPNLAEFAQQRLNAAEALRQVLYEDAEMMLLEPHKEVLMKTYNLAEIYDSFAEEIIQIQANKFSSRLNK